MRKIIFTLTAIALVFSAVNSFTACKKKDGVYKPKEKISKIYYEVIRYDSLGQRDTNYKAEKELIEVWRWDKKKLMRIEMAGGQDWSWDFFYKGSQITKIESGDMVINFSYGDKSKLQKIEVLDEKERTLMTITVDSRNDDKISKLAYVIYSYDDLSKSLTARSSLFDRLQPVMRILMGNDFEEIMFSEVANNEKVRKATTMQNLFVDLTYNGENVSQAKWNYQIGSVLETYTYTYTYDNKVNPYYRAISLMSNSDVNSVDMELPTVTPVIVPYYNLLPLSENNIVSFEARHDTNTNTIKYDYQYDSKDFPVQRTRKQEGTMQNGFKYIDHITYFYEYVE
jgi:hypothetical protein